MEFDAVGCNSRLIVREVEASGASDHHWHVRCLKGVIWGGASIEFGVGMLDMRQQYPRHLTGDTWTCKHTLGSRHDPCLILIHKGVLQTS